MPKSINSKGSGKATYFDLRAEEALFANLQFYPTIKYSNCTVWKNSYIRGFLNGLDIRKVNENEVDSYKSKSGNFAGECNFLNEAFNLSRQPILEYAIPDSETKIPEDAFNGCVTLKKLIVHSNVEHIGKKAFDGVGFKYAYRTQDGNLIFSQELLKDSEEYKEVIKLESMDKTFREYDYTMLLEKKKTNENIKTTYEVNLVKTRKVLENTGLER